MSPNPIHSSHLQASLLLRRLSDLIPRRPVYAPQLKLVEARRPALEALRRGFLFLDLSLQLELFSRHALATRAAHP